MNKIRNSHVVIVLDASARVFAAMKPPRPTIRVDGVEFHEVTCEVLENTYDLTGHHDWLVSNWRQVVGIRFYPLGSGEGVWQRMRHHRAVCQVPALHAIEIRWIDGNLRIKPTSDYIPSDFRLFESAHGAVAIAVTSEYLGWTKRVAYAGVIWD